MVTAKQAKAIAERYAKAVDLVEQGRVYRLYGYEDRFVVVNDQGQAYLVEHLSGECTCPDSQYRCSKLDIPCKHALAAAIVHERHEAEAGESPAPQPPAEPEPDDDGFPAAFCQQCGVAIERGELCDACTEQARALLRELVG